MTRIADRDDQSSDINSIQSEDEPLALPQGIQELQLGSGGLQEGVAGPVKITTDQEKPEDNAAVDSLPPPSAARPSDVGSTRSLPEVTITPSETPTRPAHQPRSESTSNVIPPSPSPSSQNMPHDTEISADARRRRQRQTNTDSAQATTRSTNRLSGFLNHLIRRDNAPSSSGLSRNAIQEDQPTSPVAEPSTAKSGSRAASPIPRPATPPPELPPPSLRELGLSLSVVTSNLSPSHFSTPPTSGAFLAPHYLLLCHAQGLDVLPLVSPPAPQPYALVRRVAFKHVVVMEQRGVLVAIAGRRDGVRVYALEEVKRAVEWRIDVEVKRERDRSKRDNLKKMALNSITPGDSSNESRFSVDKKRKQSLSTPPPGPDTNKSQVVRKSSHPHMPSPSFTAQPLIPRTATIRRPKRPATSPGIAPPPLDEPPPYSSPEPVPVDLAPLPTASLPVPTEAARSRSMSVTEVLTAGSITRRTEEDGINEDSKAEWIESSDDEAINVVAAGASGSQALDERTSAVPPPDEEASRTSHSRTGSTLSARVAQRPANLDLSLARSPTIPAPEPSPVPTLTTLREALSHANHEPAAQPGTPIHEVDDEDDEIDGHLSLTQMLMESRIPDLPPPGTTREQEAILLASASRASDAANSGRVLNASPSPSNHRSTESLRNTPTTPSRRRRWSVLVNNALTGTSSIPVPPVPPIPAPSNDRRRLLSRSQSFRSISEGSERARSRSRPPSRAASTTAPRTSSPRPITPPPLPDTTSIATSSTSRSRFIPRIISNAFNSRRSEDRGSASQRGASEADLPKRSSSATAPNQPTPPPKLEYVKLPGTKGALTIKAVETAKKSFLAILCGENGEKVELFAGTYRTALGLSRTFILPDSPRSLELQLQGDDLVEVFLVFSQNVFGLEPATVRVREVRIGRAERRAARRRARETRTDDPSTANDSEQPAGDEDGTNVNVSIGVSVAVGSTVVATGTPPQGGAGAPDALIAAEHPSQRAADDGPPTDSLGVEPVTPADPASTSSGGLGRGDDFLALATAQMGPYTTFQQLSFAPRFPLASIADDYVIPPTYSDFIDYRVAYEPDTENGQDLAQIQFSPPGLPVPMPSAPSKWLYRDPKNVVHGPWKASLMQAWYKDGLLPPDLPVRREEETEFMLLKDLRLQCIDPTHPFRSAPPLSDAVDLAVSSVMAESHKPLLKPISLLAQPRHFGPPALFFSTRGGHSTTIVDARGRSVLKGRFVWSAEDKEEENVKSGSSSGRMGDVRRLEAVDVKGGRSVLIAMRQGGLEAVDLSDALLKPGDESRTSIPQYDVSEFSNNRRVPFVWKIGTPVSTSSFSSSSTVLSSKSKGMLNPMSKKTGSNSVSKSPANKAEFGSSSLDVEAEVQDEVLFLGRSGDHIYICERNDGAFRILKLCPES